MTQTAMVPGRHTPALRIETGDLGFGPVSDVPPGPLLAQLAQSLEERRISYCQWKGHWSAHRWSTGQGDVDLLVDHAAISEFRRLMGDLGFKLVLPSGERQIPGVESYLGHDSSIPRPLHLHVHYRLVLGDYWKPVYRLPVEQAILRAAIPGQPFRVPAPTHQFFVFVLRMMLRQLGRPLLSAQTRWLAGIQPPLASLQASSDWTELSSFLQQQLPSIDVALFDRCVRSLHGESGLLERALLPWLLARRLRAHARRPLITAIATAAIEKLLPEEIAGSIVDGRMRAAGGGVVVALVGGDGAGKSTCARELAAWLEGLLPTMRAHLGNPPRSLLTWLVGGALKLRHAIGQRIGSPVAPGNILELARHVCTARDRHLLYRKVRRFAAQGGIAICERYPIRENRQLVGPCISQLLAPAAGPIAKALAYLEAGYYERMVRPDVVCVLRLDPELAVRRKPEEPADYVRARGSVIWATDWSSSGAEVIDASKPLTLVLQDLKSVIWRAL